MVAQETTRTITFSWLAYLDQEDQVGRAVCLMLGFCVERPSVQEAVAEMLDLVDDYLKMKESRGEQDVERPVPAEAWEANLAGFISQCLSGPYQKGVFWDCGLVR